MGVLILRSRGCGGGVTVQKAFRFGGKASVDGMLHVRRKRPSLHIQEYPEKTS